MSYTEKYRELQQKLNLLPNMKGDSVSGSKMRNIHNMVKRLIQNYKEDCLNQQYKMKVVQQKISSIQTQLSEYGDGYQTKNENNKMKIMKNKKKLQKFIEKWGRERKQYEQKIQHTLQNYLLQLTSTKTKVNSGSSILLKQFLNLQNTIDELERKINNQENLNKELLQRIYGQFTRQIQEMSQFLKEQKRQEELQQEKAIESLEKLYKSMENRLKSLKRERQSNEKELIDLLQRVIEKLSLQLIRQ